MTHKTHNTANRALDRAAQAAPLTRPIALAAAGMLLAGAGLAGCSRSDDAKAAVEQASRSFVTVAAGDSTAAQSEALKSYKQTEQSVKDFAGSDDGYAEAAAVTLALSRMGQAALASQDASAAETVALHKARVIRGMLSEWYTMSALAKAAGTFDPTDDIAELTSIIEMRQDDIEQYQRQLQQVSAQISDKEAQIADLREKSEAERNEAGKLELQMPRVSATQAAEIAKRVREHSMRADQYELEAIRIEGVVGQLRPGAREIGLNVEKASSQVDLLKKAIQELHDRHDANLADAKLAQDNAQSANDRIRGAVSEYSEYRESEVRSANEKAISLARSAISALRDANDSAKQTAALTKATIQQTLANCYARQAAGYAEEAITYQALGQAGVSGNWDQQRQAALESQSEAKQNADQAFQDAASALRSARVRGDQGEKIEATAVRLERLGGVTPEPEIDQDDPDADMPDTGDEPEADPDQPDDEG